MFNLCATGKQQFDDFIVALCRCGGQSSHAVLQAMQEDAQRRFSVVWCTSHMPSCIGLLPLFAICRLVVQGREIVQGDIVKTWFVVIQLRMLQCCQGLLFVIV